MVARGKPLIMNTARELEIRWRGITRNFGKDRIIRTAANLEKFVQVFKNIYVLPENFSINILALLKRLNVNVKGILTNDFVNPSQSIIQTASGKYNLLNLSATIPTFDASTAIIISAAKPAPNSIFSMNFNLWNTKIEVPVFSMTDEEAKQIYDRLKTMNLIKQYYEDLGPIGIEEISVRFARGMSTFIDPHYQDVKVQVWDRHSLKIPKYDIDDVAVVMQGPLEYKDNYTITTAKLYREWYPNVPIIISTWKNEATNEFREECKKIGVVLLENDLPEYPARGHINYQLESSFKGVEYAKKNTSVKYALKCRTDQRFNKFNFLIYFKNLLKTFSPNGDKTNERIIALSKFDDYGDVIYTPFHISDFMTFGDIEDIVKIYGIPKKTKQDSDYTSNNLHHFMKFQNIARRCGVSANLKINSMRKIRNYNVAMDKIETNELFILKSFYRENISPIDPSKLLQTYWKFLRDYLIIVDRETVLWEWPKNQDRTAYSVGSNYGCSLDHARWLDIYLNYKDEDE